MAVRVRFELTVPVKVQRFSRPPHSTTLPPHLFIPPAFSGLRSISHHYTAESPRQWISFVYLRDFHGYAGREFPHRMPKRGSPNRSPCSNTQAHSAAAG